MATGETEPREGIKIVHGTTTYLIATGTRPVTIAGDVYLPVSAGRGEQKIAITAQDSGLTFDLAIAHPLAQRYFAPGGPPQLITFELVRLELSTGHAATYWRGDITSMQPDGHIAHFSVASRLGRASLRVVPTLSASRTCGHRLYDDNCKVDRDSFKITTTVAGYNGRVITVASIGVHADQWARVGELVHVPSGERMTVTDQLGAVVTLQSGLYGIQIGDAVEVYAGCNHVITTGCQQKFANEVNFGGMNQLPKSNPFDVSGLGVLEP